MSECLDRQTMRIDALLYKWDWCIADFGFPMGSSPFPSAISQCAPNLGMHALPKNEHDDPVTMIPASKGRRQGAADIALSTREPNTRNTA